MQPALALPHFGRSTVPADVGKLPDVHPASDALPQLRDPRGQKIYEDQGDRVVDLLGRLHLSRFEG